MTTPKICPACNTAIPPGRMRCPCKCRRGPAKPPAPAVEETGRIAELARRAEAGEDLFDGTEREDTE